MRKYQIWATGDRAEITLTPSDHQYTGHPDVCPGSLIVEFEAENWEEAKKRYREFINGEETGKET